MTPEQIAAANLLSRQLAQADPVVVESIVGDDLTPGQRALVDRERARMAAPDYRDTLEDPGDLIPAGEDAEAEARWLSDYTRPPEPVDVVRDALLAEVEPMSFTGMAMFVLDALAAAGYAVVKPSGGAHLPDRPGEEALAAGWLAGRRHASDYASRTSETGDCTYVAINTEDGPSSRCRIHPWTDHEVSSDPTGALPPWNSNDMSRAVGVEPDDFDRHTALGDARWAKAIYEAVMGG